jgi:hypothetical protein
MCERIEANVRRLISSENDKLVIIRADQNDFFTPISEQISMERRIGAVAILRPKVPRRNQPWNTVACRRRLPVPLLNSTIIEEFHQDIAIPKKTQMRPWCPGGVLHNELIARGIVQPGK